MSFEPVAQPDFQPEPPPDLPPSTGAWPESLPPAGLSPAEPPPSSLPVRPAADIAGRLLAVGLALWLLLVVWIGAGFSQLAPELGLPLDAALVVTVTGLLTAAAVGVPALLLAWLWRRPRYRAIFTLWALTALMAALLALVRLLPPVHAAEAHLLQAILLAIGAGLLPLVFRRSLPSRNGQGDGAALLAGLAVALPFVAFGALGSLWEIVAALAVAAAAGWWFARLLAYTWLTVCAGDGRSPARNGLTGGLAAGVALLLLSSSLGAGGASLLLMLVVPPLGLVASFLAQGTPFNPAAARRSTALLVTVAVAAVLLFADTEGLSLLAGDAILLEMMQAATLALAIGWVLILIYGLAGARPFLQGAGGWWLAGAAGVVTLALFMTGGQTGLHGNRLYVVMAEQADLAALATLPYPERRSAVFQSLTEQATRTQASLRSTLDAVGIPYTPFYLENAMEVEGGYWLRLWLESRPDVDRVLASPRLRPTQNPPAPPTGTALAPDEPAWNLTLIGAPAVWADFGARGAGIIVGESDSGVEWTHEELVDGYLGRDGDHDYHWFDPWYGSREPVDLGGHGTHTLGSVLGNRVGVAPDADWIGCANLTRNVGNPALYLTCMQFMLAPFPLDGDPFADGDPARGAHVLNNSWGCPPEYEGCDAESLRSAVAALEMAGVFVVASAGNSGPACSTVADPIAMFGEAFSVGALDEQGNLAPFSSRGPVTLDGSGRIKPDIAAPGVDVLSAYPNNSYELASGTSMAGPHVAGVVALIWSANPALIGDVAATRALLTRSATPFTGGIGGGDPFAAEPAAPVAVMPCVTTEGAATTPNTWAGYGIVNAYEAVSAALAP